MFRSPSPSLAAPKSGASAPYIMSTNSLAYVRLGSGCPCPKSSKGTPLEMESAFAPSWSTKMGFA
eukprot:Gb_12737 [translate_table: standard]